MNSQTFKRSLRLIRVFGFAIFPFMLVFLTTPLIFKTGVHAASEDSYQVNGRVFIDRDGNDDFHPGIDEPIPNQTVFHTEYKLPVPVVTPLVTDSSGYYSLSRSISENDYSEVVYPLAFPFPTLPLSYFQDITIFNVRPVDSSVTVFYRDVNNSEYGVYFKGKDQLPPAQLPIWVNFIARNISNLQVTCSPKNSSVFIGDNVTYTANASGLFGNYSYSWSGDVSGNSNVINTSYSAAGNKTATVTVTDIQTGFTAQDSCSTSVSIPPPPKPTISSSLTCINPNYTGNGFTVSWTNNGIPVTWVDILVDGSWFGISVSTTPNSPANITIPNNYPGLTLQPSTTYYVRLYNGVYSPAPYDGFTTPNSCPDLITSGLGLNTGSLISGNPVTLKGTVTNNGATQTGVPFSNSFQIDLDNPAFTTADATLTPASIANLSGFTPQQVVSGSWTAVIGTHTLRLCADSTNTVAESNESNNCTDWTFTVNPPLPTVDLKVDNSNGPLTVANNLPHTLTWTSTGPPTTCNATSVDWTGAKAINNTSPGEPTGNLANPPKATYTYTITCSNISGNASDSVTVNVVPLPTVDLKVDNSNGPLTVANNLPHTLTWTSTGPPTTCNATSVDWTGAKAINNTSPGEPTGNLANPPTAAYTYTITCSNISGSVPDSVTVNVSGPLAVSCTPNSTTGSTTDTIIYTSNVTSGVAPFTYSWSGTDGLIGNGSSVSKMYGTWGTKTATVVVTDSMSITGSASCPNVTIVPPPASPILSLTGNSCINVNLPYISLSWTAVANVNPPGPFNKDSYNIYRKTPDTAYVLIASFITPVLTYTDNSVLQNIDYTYQVVARNGSGAGASWPPLVVTSSDCTPKLPEITDLKVSQPTTQSSLQARPGISGLQTVQGGRDWNNPMTIRVSANAFTNPKLPPPPAELTEQYVAFYDKNSGPQLTNPATFLTDVQTRLNPDPKNGFLLAYGNDENIAPADDADSTPENQYFVWNTTTGGWVNVTAFGEITLGYNVQDLYNVYNVNAPSSWKIRFRQDFGSKIMYTPVLVKDNYGMTKFSDNNPVNSVFGN